MTLSRSLCTRACRFVVGVFAWAQLAVASHACPLLVEPAPRAAADSATAAPCDVMEMRAGLAAEGIGTAETRQLDTDAGVLCVEHCRFGQQSNGSTASPVVDAAFLVQLYPLTTAPAAAMLASAERIAEPPEATAAPPPHAILHCCFRI
jgi:hypothetical protein